MVGWGSFAKEQPALAASGMRLFGGEKAAIGFIATVARDGRPRMAAVSLIFTEGRMYLSVGATTPKRFDLASDGRYVLHAFLGENDGENDEEFQVSGRAKLVLDDAERGRVHEAIAFIFERDNPIFVLDIVRCLWGYWEKVGQPGTLSGQGALGCPVSLISTSRASTDRRGQFPPGSLD